MKLFSDLRFMTLDAAQVVAAAAISSIRSTYTQKDEVVGQTTSERGNRLCQDRKKSAIRIDIATTDPLTRFAGAADAMDLDAHSMTTVGVPEGRSELQTPAQPQRQPYKSYKKKFRKMKMHFDQKMMINQNQYKEEQRAAEKGRQLALENDQLLEFLLDVNSSAQMPPHLRFDLDMDEPRPIPDFLKDTCIPGPYVGTTAHMLHEGLTMILARQAGDRAIKAKPAKSLAQLQAAIPSRPFDTLPEGIQKDLRLPHPVAYLSPDQVDEAASRMDASLGLAVSPTLHNSAALAIPKTDRELDILNPNSVYNWLRTHEPQVFLQDGEDLGTGNGGGSAREKSGKVAGGNKRGGGVGTPAAIKQEGASLSMERRDEDMLDDGDVDAFLTPVNPTKSGKGSKRKRRDDDDVGYRPKGGSSRPAKKKKAGEGGSRKVLSMNIGGVRMHSGLSNSPAADDRDGSELPEGMTLVDIDDVLQG